MVGMVWPHMEVQWLHDEHGMASYGSINGYMVSMVWPHMEVQWLHGEHGMASHGSTMVTW